MNIQLVGKNISEFPMKREIWEPVNYPNTKLWVIVEDPDIVSGIKFISVKGYVCHVDINGLICKNLGVQVWEYKDTAAETLINSILAAIIIGTEITIETKLTSSMSSEVNLSAYDLMAANCVPPFIKPS